MSFKTIAAVAHGELVEADALRMLSAGEDERYRRISHSGRKLHWLCGRIAAKYLFLEKLCEDRACEDGPRVIGRAALNRFPEWAYRSVEVLPRRGDAGPPAIFWAGKMHSLHISIAHTTRFSTACLDDAPIGLDIEVPEKRSAAFYRRTFSARERSWAECAADRERAYTFMWCLKESALKAEESERTSLWRIADVEIELDCPETGVVAGLAVSKGRIRYGHQVRPIEAALADLDNAVLATLRIQ